MQRSALLYHISTLTAAATVLLSARPLREVQTLLITDSPPLQKGPAACKIRAAAGFLQHCALSEAGNQGNRRSGEEGERLTGGGEGKVEEGVVFGGQEGEQPLGLAVGDARSEPGVEL